MSKKPTTTFFKACRGTLYTFCALILLFLVVPILIIIPMSFNPGDFFVFPPRGVSLRWYAEVFASDAWLSAAKNSLFIATMATILATVLGTLAALGLTHARFRFKGLVTAILISPMVVPLVITAVAMFFFYSRLHVAGSYLGMIMAHAALGLPFVVITVTATLQNYDRNLTLAAASLGATPLWAFFSVILPIILPGVVSGALFAFATSFDEIIVALFLATPEQQTLPREIFSGIRQSISPTVTAVASILIVVSVLFMLVLIYLQGRADRMVRRGGVG